MTDNREYRIAMNSLDAITLMGIIDSAACEMENEQLRENMYSIVEQINKDHTRFLEHPINLENNMAAEQKPIDIAIEQIQHDRTITGLAAKIIAEAKKAGVDEDDILIEVRKRMVEIHCERFDEKLYK